MSDEANVTNEEDLTAASADGQVDDQGTSNEDTQSVDDLLREFDNDTTSDDTSGQDASGSSDDSGEDLNDNANQSIDDNPKFQEMHKHFEKQRRAQTDTDLNNAADTIRDAHDALKNVPRSLLRGLLQDRAGDKRFVSAFVNRESNPEAWGSLLRAVGREVGEQFKKAPDSKLSDDMSSLRSAVKSTDGKSSSSGPTDKEVMAMSDQEFNEHTKKQGLNTASGWG